MADVRSEFSHIVPKIHVSDVNFFYGKTQALKNINMQVFSNQVTAIIGASGCGKSTLLRTFNRIYSIYPGQRATGKIFLDGENILDARYNIGKLRARVGMVFQKPTPFHMSIYDNIAFAIRHYERLSKSELSHRVKVALRESALWDEVKDSLKRSALGLSGGQQQRLCIARAIAIKPEVLLLDEPTSALDPIATAKIEALFEELRKEFTVVIVTHNMQQAARVSGRTAFMNLGELIELDDTKKIFTKPSVPLTEQYITGHFG